MNIPPVYSDALLEVELAAGMQELARTIPMQRISRILDGMIYHVGSSQLRGCTNGQERLMCQARVQVITELQQMLLGEEEQRANGAKQQQFDNL